MKKPKLPKGYEWAKVGDIVENDWMYWSLTYKRWSLCLYSIGETVKKARMECMGYIRPITSPLQRDFDRTTMASRMLRAYPPNKYGYDSVNWLERGFAHNLRTTAIKLAIKELEEEIR